MDEATIQQMDREQEESFARQMSDLKAAVEVLNAPFDNHFDSDVEHRIEVNGTVVDQGILMFGNDDSAYVVSEGRTVVSPFHGYAILETLATDASVRIALAEGTVIELFVRLKDGAAA
jgi:hypothetical protein